MPEAIRFDENYINDMIQRIRKISGELEDASNEMGRLDVGDTGAGSLGTRLNCRISTLGAVCSASNMSSAFRQTTSYLSRLSDYSQRLANNLQTVSNRFVETENRLMGVEGESSENAQNKGGFDLSDAILGTGAKLSELGEAIWTGISNAGEAIWTGVGNAGKAIVDNWKTGAEIIKGKLSDCVAAFAKDWEEKGISYRIIKGIGGAVNMIAGAATVFCAVAGTGLTAGLGTPATVLIGTYGANTAISGFADLFNCITGNVDAVGEVDMLKSALTTVCGQTGKLLGNEKLGESVGEAIYTVGGLTATVVSINNLIGQIKQAPNAGKTLVDSFNSTKQMVSQATKEIPEALNGLGYIATKVNLRDIPYNLALLSKQLPSITGVIADAKLVSKGVDYGKKLIDAGVDIVNSFADCTMLEQPAFMNTYEQVKKAISFPSSVVDDLKESYKNIDDALSVKLIEMFS